MDEKYSKKELVIKILAGIIPFIIFLFFIFLTNNNGGSNETGLLIWLPYTVAITLGALPLIFGKVYFPHGKLTSIAIYAALMYVLLLFFSIFISCWFLGQCL